jgi:hypothetical protein
MRALKIKRKKLSCVTTFSTSFCIMYLFIYDCLFYFCGCLLKNNPQHLFISPLYTFFLLNQKSTLFAICQFRATIFLCTRYLHIHLFLFLLFFCIRVCVFSSSCNPRAMFYFIFCSIRNVKLAEIKQLLGRERKIVKKRSKLYFCVWDT